MLIRTMLGLHADASLGQLTLEKPDLPKDITKIVVKGLRVGECLVRPAAPPLARPHQRGGPAQGRPTRGHRSPVSRGGRDAARPLRIAQVAPPLEAVPPIAYGGTERIVAELVQELDRRGHQVTTFASGDSRVPGEHVVTVPAALRPTGFADDPAAHFEATVAMVLDRADGLRPHPRARRSVEPGTAPSRRHPGRVDVPWQARCPLGTGRVLGATGRPCRRQPGPGPRPSRGGLDGHPSRPDIRSATDGRDPRRGSLLRRPHHARERASSMRSRSPG